LAVSFVCPFDGVVPPETVLAIVRELSGVGVAEVLLADTIGRATPEQVRETAGRARDAFPELDIGCHLHDIDGSGPANVDAALTVGVRRFDSATGGLGGCPFAPGAGGNLATETLVPHLHDNGYATGVAADAVRQLAAELPGLLRQEPADTMAALRR